MSAAKRFVAKFFAQSFFDEPRRIERTVACSDFHSVFVVHSVEQQEQIIWHWVEQMWPGQWGRAELGGEGGLAWKETLMRSIQEGRETRQRMGEQEEEEEEAKRMKNADLAAGGRGSPAAD